MGKQIHLKKIEELFEKSPVVDFKSVERIVGKTQKSNYAKLLISNMLKRGKIKKIGKGFYTFHNDSSLVVFAFKPAYLGLQCALSYYGLWEQETIPVILTIKKVRTGIRKILETNVLVRRIDKKYFFGFDFVKDGEFYIPYSDLEKTFIDIIVFNQKIDENTLKNIKKRINLKKLKIYLSRYPKRIQERVEKAIKKK